MTVRQYTWEPSSMWARIVAYKTLIAADYSDEHAWTLSDKAMRVWEYGGPWVNHDRGIVIGVAGIVAADLQAKADDAMTLNSQAVA